MRVALVGMAWAVMGDAMVCGREGVGGWRCADVVMWWCGDGQWYGAGARGGKRGEKLAVRVCR